MAMTDAIATMYASENVVGWGFWGVGVVPLVSVPFGVEIVAPVCVVVVGVVVCGLVSVVVSAACVVWLAVVVVDEVVVDVAVSCDVAVVVVVFVAMPTSFTHTLASLVLRFPACTRRSMYFETWPVFSFGVAPML